MSEYTLAYCTRCGRDHYFGFGAAGEMVEGLACRRGERPRAEPESTAPDPLAGCEVEREVIEKLVVRGKGRQRDAVAAYRHLEAQGFSVAGTYNTTHKAFTYRAEKRIG